VDLPLRAHTMSPSYPGPRMIEPSSARSTPLISLSAALVPPIFIVVTACTRRIQLRTQLDPVALVEEGPLLLRLPGRRKHTVGENSIDGKAEMSLARAVHRRLSADEACAVV